MGLIVASARDRSAAVERLRPVERRAVDGAAAEDMAAGCLVLDVIEDGAIVGAMAVELQGDAATITAAAGSARRPWAALRLVERGLKQQGVRSVTLHTRRRGLLAALMPQGYRIDRCTLTKEL
ncbi:MAG: hypothetical protein KBC73_05510 [Burkholderiaceae bacterium]|nr:hypothetical protein [Burkholderiaceae bacterium]